MLRLNKKIVASLSASALLLAGQTVMASPASAVINCAEGRRTVYTTLNDGSMGNDEWFIRVSVLFAACSNGKKKWVKPRALIVFYDQEGDRMGCGLHAWNGLRYVSYDPLYTDSLGHKFNPSPIRVPCDTSTAGGAIQQYKLREVPRLYWGGRYNQVPPYFKVGIDVEKKGILYDAHGKLSGRFYMTV